MTNLTPGQPVEVNLIFASNGWPNHPTKVWSSGYVLEGFRGDLVVVKQVKKGLLKDCTFNCLREDVRKEVLDD